MAQFRVCYISTIYPRYSEIFNDECDAIIDMTWNNLYAKVKAIHFGTNQFLITCFTLSIVTFAQGRSLQPQYIRYSRQTDRPKTDVRHVTYNKGYYSWIMMQFTYFQFVKSTQLIICSRPITNISVEWLDQVQFCITKLSPHKVN